MSQAGLTIIAIGWLLQWLGGKDGKIEQSFSVLYIAGVLLLVLDGYRSGMMTLATLNLATMVLALMVYLRLKK